jgi:hypothetical protein
MALMIKLFWLFTLSGIVFAIIFKAKSNGMLHFVKSGVIPAFETVLPPHPVLNYLSNQPTIASCAAFHPDIERDYRQHELYHVVRERVAFLLHLDSSLVHLVVLRQWF